MGEGTNDVELAHLKVKCADNSNNSAEDSESQSGGVGVFVRGLKITSHVNTRLKANKVAILIKLIFENPGKRYDLLASLLGGC